MLMLPQVGFEQNSASCGFDPNNMGASLTLSNSNQNVTATTATIRSVRGAKGHNTGAYYFEVYEVNQYTVNTIRCGFCTSAATDFSGYSTPSPGVSYAPTNGTSTITGGIFTAYTTATVTVTPGVTYQFAVDMNGGSIWYGYEGSWNQGTTPVVGSTTGRNLSFTGAPWLFPCCAVYYSPTQIRLKTAAGSFKFQPPRGFQPWALC